MKDRVPDVLRKLHRAGIGLASRHLAEICSVVDSVRSCARVVINGVDEPMVRESLGSLGLHCGIPTVENQIVRKLGDDRYCERVPRNSLTSAVGTLSIMVARDAQAANEAQRIDDSGTAEQCGRLLGYPACCVSSYSNIEKGVDWVQALADASHPGPHEQPWTSNCLAGLFTDDSLHPDFFPCRLGCPNARDLVERIARAARSCGLNAEYMRGVEAMSGVFALFDRAVVVLSVVQDSYVPKSCVLRDVENPSGWELILADRLARYIPVAAGVMVENQGRAHRLRGCLCTFHGRGER